MKGKLLIAAVVAALSAFFTPTTAVASCSVASYDDAMFCDFSSASEVSAGFIAYRESSAVNFFTGERLRLYSSDGVKTLEKLFKQRIFAASNSQLEHAANCYLVASSLSLENLFSNLSRLHRLNI
ncbi:MAG: hypothetical protein LBK47_04620 [Prevotellaceae bacterium]|nr:hypothetical protein [Prevotellaceae bacterium]